MLRRHLKAQEDALTHLKAIDPMLYEAAVELDRDLLSYRSNGPTLTPPIKDYYAPDGSYTDTTKQWN